MAEVDVDIDISVENNTSVVLNEITNNVLHLHQAVQRNERQNSRWLSSLKKIAGQAASVAKAVGKVAASTAAVAAATGPAASGLLAAGKAVAAFGKASARLVPLAAFLPSLIGSFALVTATVKLMGAGFAKAFEPLTAYFVDAKGEAGSLAKRLQAIAETGLKPLVKEFARLNMPAIARGMEDIARQVNGVVASTVRLLNTAKGQQAIRTITEGTAVATAKLAVKVNALTDAIVGLTVRAGGRGINAIADAIGRVLDKITKWADATGVEDINRALDDLSGYGIKIKQVFTAVRDVGRWMAENEGAVKRFSDVVAAAAVTIGLATGNIFAVIAGTVALIINHWEDLKGPFVEAVDWVKNIADAWQKDAGRIMVFDAIANALRAAKDAFMSVMESVGPQWKVFTEELAKAWEEWAPLIAAWWNSGGKDVFVAFATAIGLIIAGLLAMSIAAVKAAQVIAVAFKAMVGVVLDVLGALINGAAKAFSWVPGLGPKLAAAAKEFNDFRDRVNASLAGIKDRDVHVNVRYNNPGRAVAGNSVYESGSGGYGLTSWQAAATAFAGAAAGRDRTGGPQSLTATVQNTILLDGRPFRAYTDQALLDSERRAAWRSKTGRR